MDFNEFKERYDIKLNPQQEEAVLKAEGPCLLTAVPGAGKTTVIAVRTGYMVLVLGIAPESILTLTFTVAAAREMKERFLAKFGAELYGAIPHFSTIHSFCVSVIRHAERVHRITVPVLEPENARIVRDAYTAMTGEYPADTIVKELSQKITYCKNMCFSKEQIKGIRVLGIDFPALYEKYESIKTAKGSMDFDDQLLLALEILTKYPDILDAFTSKYRYISVDEAQDTSFLQHRIIGLLASRQNNIFMVGDDDQSIYGFRAAYPKALLDFEETYREAKILFMETNYRSCNEITSAAERFIRQNKERRDKSIHSDRGAGAHITQTNIGDAAEQYRYLLSRAKRKEKDTTMAVLYRNNESAVPVIDIFLREGVGFSSRDALGTFFTHPVVTDMLAILRLSLDMSDVESYGKIYYKFGTFTSKREMLALELCKDEHRGECVFDTLRGLLAGDRSQKKYDKSKKDFKEMSAMGPAEAILYASEESGYRKWLARLCADGYSKGSILQKINTMLAVAQECLSTKEFIERMEILERPRKNTDPNLILSTVHSAKGLEFDEVIILDAFEGILPQDESVKEANAGNYGPLEEEVRLFYVAVTRAKNALEIVSSIKRFGTPATVSRFAEELLGKKLPERRSPGDLPAISVSFKNPALDKIQKKKEAGKGAEFRLGVKVLHNKFGEGFITEKNENIVTIKFVPSGDKKKFDISGGGGGVIKVLPRT